jgi:hypothetical protein
MKTYICPEITTIEMEPTQVIAASDNDITIDTSRTTTRQFNDRRRDAWDDEETW